MAVDSASSIRTGPVRCFRRSARIASFPWTSFFRALMLLTSPMTFSSSAMRACVAAMRCAFRLDSEASESYQSQFPTSAKINTPPTTTRNCRPISRFFSWRTGRRLMWIIMAGWSSRELVSRTAKREPHRHRRHRRDVHDEGGVEAAVVDLDVLERVQDLHRNAHPSLDGLEEGGDLCRSPGEVDLAEARVGCRAGVEVERALDLSGDLLCHPCHHPLDFLGNHRVRLGATTTDLQRLRLLVG